MSDPATAERTSTTGTDSRPRTRVTTRQLYGIACGVLCAGLFKTMFASGTQTNAATFPAAGAIGSPFAFSYNLPLGRDAIHTDWTDKEPYRCYIGVFRSS